jgi:hypothetical protein
MIVFQVREHHIIKTAFLRALRVLRGSIVFQATPSDYVVSAIFCGFHGYTKQKKFASMTCLETAHDLRAATSVQEQT